MQESLDRQVCRSGALRVRHTFEQADRGVPRYNSCGISPGVATPSQARRADEQPKTIISTGRRSVRPSSAFTVLHTGSLFELQSAMQIRTEDWEKVSPVCGLIFIGGGEAPLHDR